MYFPIWPHKSGLLALAAIVVIVISQIFIPSTKDKGKYTAILENAISNLYNEID